MTSTVFPLSLRMTENVMSPSDVVPFTYQPSCLNVMTYLRVPTTELNPHFPRPAPHAAWHAPQRWLSVCVFVSQPLALLSRSQSDQPASHVPVHFPTPPTLLHAVDGT